MFVFGLKLIAYVSSQAYWGESMYLEESVVDAERTLTPYFLHHYKA